MGFWRDLFTGGPITAVVNQTGGYFERKQNLKKVRVESQARIAEVAAGTAATVTLNRLQVQQLRIKDMGGTLKDEYALLILTGPVTLMLLGCVLDPLFIWMEFEYSLFAAGERALKVMTGLEGEYALHFYAAITACLALSKIGRR